MHPRPAPVTFTGTLGSLAALVALAACGGDHAAGTRAANPPASTPPAASASPADSASGARAITVSGLASPETALWDSVADVYLVSNVNGGATDEDHNGFIARVSPDGRVMQRKWIDGAQAGVQLNGPKGMLFEGDTLFVADVGGVRVFDRRSGRQLGSIAIDSRSLNDLALGPDGTLYVSDLGPGKGGAGVIWRVSGRTATPLVRGSDLDQPDGILYTQGKLLVAPFGGGAELYYVSLTGQRTPGPRVPGGTMDGLETLPDSSIAVTSWDAKTVYRLDAAGNATPLFTGLESPAQIGLDRKRDRLLVPLFNANRLVIEPLSP
ncbi:MAG TPA: hypothetical protein VFL93_02105 [Longimicrobiaceae bacterium]|nr:hypothetical protein [Longimicrobiaceae bacterium]